MCDPLLGPSSWYFFEPKTNSNVPLNITPFLFFSNKPQYAFKKDFQHCNSLIRATKFFLGKRTKIEHNSN